eukprot:TRINITY_DN28267_c0_g1_i1.p1 TRINITY_DN28267_c0_g1~~TRINITY_DN28267_c0_g1_i1.p1  ORF type:complete len:765 (-),score=140.02 TRINITY_DN28267_c0_g1_i1:111-2405(-)
MAFFWKMDIPELTLEDEMPAPRKLPGALVDFAPLPRRACDTAASFEFWRLPLESLESSPRPRPACDTAASFEFWRLPLASLESSDDEGTGQQTVSGSTDEALTQAVETAPAATAASVTPQAPEAEAVPADLEPPVEKAEAVPADVELPVKKAPVKRQSKVAEWTETLDRYCETRDRFERNLKELAEMQERLRKLTVEAAASRASAEVGCSAVSKRVDEVVMVGGLLRDIVDRMLWHLDVTSLGRATSVCRDWASVAGSADRWASICETDWGINAGGSFEEYRRRLERLHCLRTTMESNRTTGGPCGSFGSQSRRRLIDALLTLSDMGSARNHSARYPAQVPALMRASDGARTLLALLEDESPYLLCLAVRCLADLASNEDERCHLRSEIVSKGRLVRSLLEGEDVELTEASARMMLNLHDGVPGTPLVTRRRGPWEFLQGYPEVDLHDVGTLSSPWSGIWVGEMRYARGGERHAALQVVLGPKGDPAVDRARSFFRAAANSDQEDDGAASSASAEHRLRSEGRAEYWHFFGFLADSDFDCAAETAQYVDEQLEQRRKVPAMSTSRQTLGTGASSMMLEGAGWDDQNGAFTVEAALPRPKRTGGSAGPSSPSSKARPTTPKQSTSEPSTPQHHANASDSAIPLRLNLTYERRGSNYQMTGFLAEGRSCNDEALLQHSHGDGHGSHGGKAAVMSAVDAQFSPAIYGVWATAPSQHKHLFVLRRLRDLPQHLPEIDVGETDGSLASIPNQNEASETYLDSVIRGVLE